MNRKLVASLSICGVLILLLVGLLVVPPAAGPAYAGPAAAPLASKVTVGKGSYTTVLPPGKSGPSVLACKNGSTTEEPARRATPVVEAGFSGVPQTHDWWSSVMWKANNFWDGTSGSCVLHKYSENLHPHPWGVRFEGGAYLPEMVMGYTDHYHIADTQYQDTYRTYQHQFWEDFQVIFKDSSLQEVEAEDTRLSRYSDWEVTTYSSDGSGHSWKTTMVEGSPYVFFETKDIARVEFRLAGTTGVTAPTGTQPAGFTNVLGLTQPFKMPANTGMTPNPVTHYFGFFGPTGSKITNDSGDWRVFSIRNLPSDGYFSIAILPDDSAATLEYYRKRAYAFPSGTRVSWTYDESKSRVTTDFTVSTKLKPGESAGGAINKTLQALYRHQYLNLSAPSSALLTSYGYDSVAGQMVVLSGNSFSTTLNYQGTLPILSTQAHDANYTSTLKGYLQSAVKTAPSPDTYFNGKEMARLGQLALIADQLGEDGLRDEFLTPLKQNLQDWLVYDDPSDPKFMYYDQDWKSMTGYDAGTFYSDTLLNDHHFHFGYFIQAAAVLAKFEADWDKSTEWGGMIDLLIKDVANQDRSDKRFPFLRFFDPYAGHNWANGAANGADGNNQESSSEAINFANALIQWGTVTGDDRLRDLGIYLHVTEASAAHQYWLDKDDAVFPNQPDSQGRDFVWKSVGVVWGGKGDATTYFGASPGCVVGINILPVTGGSLYLGQYPSHVHTIYNQAAKAYDKFICWTPAPGTQKDNPPANADDWAPIFWEYLAFKDADAAFGMFDHSVAWMQVPSSGTSAAQVYHWLANMKSLGQVDTSVTANHPLYAVFSKPVGAGTTTGLDGAGAARIVTYVAHNHTDQDKTITFSDGVTVTVPAGGTGHHSRYVEGSIYVPLMVH